MAVSYLRVLSVFSLLPILISSVDSLPVLMVRPWRPAEGERRRRVMRETSRAERGVLVDIRSLSRLTYPAVSELTAPCPR